MVVKINTYNKCISRRLIDRFALLIAYHMLYWLIIKKVKNARETACVAEI